MRAIESGELFSFLLVAAMMLSASLFFPSFYWAFILFAIVDGVATRYQYGSILAFDRIAFSFIILLLSAAALNLDVLLMILVTTAIIALLDISFLLRRIRHTSGNDFFRIVSLRLGSYLYTLLPAAILSSALAYLGASSVSFVVIPQYAILELGLASVIVFVITLAVVRRVDTLK